MVYEDLIFKLFAGIWIFQLNEQSFVRTVAILMIKKTFEKLDPTGFGVFFKKFLDTIFELFFENLNLSLVVYFIWKSF